jgi:hypothetical protein
MYVYVCIYVCMYVYLTLGALSAVPDVEKQFHDQGVMELLVSVDF